MKRCWADRETLTHTQWFMVTPDDSQIHQESLEVTDTPLSLVPTSAGKLLAMMKQQKGFKTFSCYCCSAQFWDVTGCGLCGRSK